MAELGFYTLLALVIVNSILLFWLLIRKQPDNGKTELLALISAGNDKTEREVRREIVDNGRTKVLRRFAPRTRRSMLLASNWRCCKKPCQTRLSCSCNRSVNQTRAAWAKCVKLWKSS